MARNAYHVSTAAFVHDARVRRACNRPWLLDTSEEEERNVPDLDRMIRAMSAEGPRARRRRAIAERFFRPSSLCYLRSRVLLAYPVYSIRSITLELDLSRRETVISRSSLLRSALNRAKRSILCLLA